MSSQSTPPPAPEIDPVLQRATWLAATVGPFRPADLVGRVTDEPVARRSLAARLAQFCTEVSTSGGVLWNLAADIRRQALEEMQRLGVLEAQKLPDLLEQLAPVPQDAFGRHLREALCGTPNPDAGQESELDALYSAFEFVGRGNVGVAPEQAQESAGVVEQRAQRAAADRQLVQTIGPVFVGRTRELESLQGFALTGRVDAPEFIVDAPPHAGRTPMVFIDGVGGAGKSALIAKLVRRMRQADSGVAATVILDFDRPTLSNLDAVELTRELIRQISLSQPRIAKALIQLRRQALNEFTGSELASSNAVENYFRDSRAVYSINLELRKVVEGAGIAQQPILIILDTFEEVLTLGELFVQMIYQWLEDLRSHVGLTQLRVVVSGRATPADLQHETERSGRSPAGKTDSHVVGSVPLAELPEKDAYDLLEQRGIDEPLARQLVSLFGSNPLVLRLLGDYAAQNGPESVRALMSDEDNRGRYRAEAAQRILYSRILDRIRDDKAVRELASPGLVVRVVTPGVIRKVLAERCGLGRIDSARAQDLFRKLARHVWLVRRIGERAVSHRRDMRTLMLPLAREPRRGEDAKVLAVRVAEIHAGALEYFRAEADPDLPATTQRNEALYHRLFVDPSGAFEDPGLTAALPNLAVDLADFPAHQRARLKRLLGRALLPDEEAALTVEESSEYALQREIHETRRTGARSARPAARQGHVAPPPAAVAEQTARSESATVAAFAEGSFEEAADHCANLLVELIVNVSRGKSALPREMTEHATWLASLSTLEAEARRPNSTGHPEWLHDVIAQLTQSWKSLASRELNDKSGLTVAHYLTAIVVMLGGERRFEPKLEQLGGRIGSVRFEVTSTASLRILQLLAALSRKEKIALKPTAVSAPCLQYLASLLEPRVAILGRVGTDTQREWRAQMPALSKLNATLERLVVDGTPPTTSDLAKVERMMIDERLDLYDWGPPRGSQESAVESRRTLGWPALRGMSPDLKAPMLTALRTLFQEQEAGERILHELSRCSKAWPTDLAPDALQPERVSDSYLATLCHYADRFGALPLLLELGSFGGVARIHKAYSDIFWSVSGSR